MPGPVVYLWAAVLLVEAMRELTVQKLGPPVIERDFTASADRTFWAKALIPCVTGSAACFIAGLSISVLSAFELIAQSRRLAYSAIGLLFGAFVLMFLAAHCMDRRDAAEKIERITEAERTGLTRSTTSR